MKNLPVVFTVFAAGLACESDGAVLCHYLDGTNSLGNFADTVPGLEVSPLNKIKGSVGNKFTNTLPVVEGGTTGDNYWWLTGGLNSFYNSNQDCLSFSLTLGAGMTVESLTSLDFTMGFASTTGTGAFTMTYTLYADTGNGYQQVKSEGISSGSLALNDFSSTDVSVDLSSLDLTGATNQISFKIVLKANTSYNSRSAAISNLKLNGTVNSAIPEPATATLGALGLVCLLARRRRES